MATDGDAGAFVIEGHIVSDQELEIFWTVMRVGRYNEAARLNGVSPKHVRRIMATPWVKKLYDTKIKVRNESFMHRIQELDDKALTAYEEILDGGRADDRSTMAQAKLIEIRMKAGKDPILDTRAQSVTVKAEQHNINMFLSPDQLRTMTPEELIEMNRSGTVPERFRKAAEPVEAWNPPRELPFDAVGFKTLQNRAKQEKLETATEGDADQPPAGDREREGDSPGDNS